MNVQKNQIWELITTEGLPQRCGRPSVVNSKALREVFKELSKSTMSDSMVVTQ